MILENLFGNILGLILLIMVMVMSLGLIVLFDTNNNSPLDSSKISLLKLSAKILANEV